MVTASEQGPSLAAFVGISHIRTPVPSGGRYRHKLRQRDQAAARRWNAHCDAVAKAAANAAGPPQALHSGDATRELLYGPGGQGGAVPPSPQRVGKREIVPEPPKVMYMKETKKKCFDAPREGWVLKESEVGLRGDRAARKGDRDALKYWRARGETVQDKPNNIACAVGKGAYSAELQARTAVQHLYVDRSIGSGLDYHEDKVPLYSSFANDKKFLDPAVREVERLTRELQRSSRKTVPRRVKADPNHSNLVSCVTEMLRTTPQRAPSGACTDRPIRPSPPTPFQPTMGAGNPAAGSGQRSRAQTSRGPKRSSSSVAAGSAASARHMIVGFASRAGTPAPTPGGAPVQPTSSREHEVMAMLARELADVPAPPDASSQARSSLSLAAGGSVKVGTLRPERSGSTAGASRAGSSAEGAGVAERAGSHASLSVVTSVQSVARDGPQAQGSDSGTQPAEEVVKADAEAAAVAAAATVRPASAAASFGVSSCEMPMPQSFADTMQGDVGMSVCSPQASTTRRPSSKATMCEPQPPPPPSSRSTWERTPGPTHCSTPYSPYSRPGTATSIPFSTFTNFNL